MSISCVQHDDVVQGLTNGMGPAPLPWNKPRPENLAGRTQRKRTEGESNHGVKDNERSVSPAKEIFHFILRASCRFFFLLIRLFLGKEIGVGVRGSPSIICLLGKNIWSASPGSKNQNVGKLLAHPQFCEAGFQCGAQRWTCATSCGRWVWNGARSHHSLQGVHSTCMAQSSNHGNLKKLLLNVNNRPTKSQISWK